MYTFPHSYDMLYTPVNMSPVFSFTGLNMHEVFLTGMSTAFTLKLLSNQLILYDVVCWNSKMVTSFSFSFPVIACFYDM
jgi:hypothetical protein